MISWQKEVEDQQGRLRFRHPAPIHKSPLIAVGILLPV